MPWALSGQDVTAVFLGCCVPVCMQILGHKYLRPRLEAISKRRAPWYVRLEKILSMATRTAYFHEPLLMGLPGRVDNTLGLVSRYRDHPIFMQELHKRRVNSGWNFLILLTFIFTFASPAFYDPSGSTFDYAWKTFIFSLAGLCQSALTHVKDDVSILFASWPDFSRALMAVNTFAHTTAPSNAGVFFTVSMCRQLYMALYFESFAAYILYSVVFLFIPMFNSEWFWYRSVGYPLAMLVVSSGMVLPAMQERVLRLDSKVEEYIREKVFEANMEELENVQNRHEAELKRRHEEYICALENKHKESTQKLHMVLSYTAHEYRNHFFQARGALDDLQDMAHSSEMPTADAGAIVEASKTLGSAHAMIQSLFDDVLQMHRLETAGEVDWRGSARPFQVGRDLFERAQDYGMTSLRRQSEVTFEAVLNGDPTAEVMGNPEKFLQVITNLISNAVKFTATGSISLELSCIPIPTSSTEMELSLVVSDTGQGIPEEKIGKLFKPFAQARSAAEFGYGGSGLGLYFARNIMLAYPHGSLDVESKIGKGTTFRGRLRLPLNPNPSPDKSNVEIASPEVTTLTSTSSSSSPLKGGAGASGLSTKLSNGISNGAKKASSSNGTANGSNNNGDIWEESDVLVVDDSQVNRALLRRMLERRCSAETRIYEACNGQEAVTMATELGSAISVILMDRHMPVMDGIEATRHIREFNQSVLIIAVTGNADDETHSRFRSAGCDVVWHKGSSVASLFSLIRKVRHAKTNGDTLPREIPAH